MTIRDGNGTDFFGTRPSPNERDSILINGFGMGLNFFLKPRVGLGIVPSRLYIKLIFKINLI